MVPENPTITEALDKLCEEFDIEKRKELCKTIQTEWMSWPVAIEVIHSPSIVAYNKRLMNLFLGPACYDNDFRYEQVWIPPWERK